MTNYIIGLNTSKICCGHIKEGPMLRASIAFSILAIVAFVLGASGIAGVSMEIGKLLLTVFLVLAVISFIIDLVGRRGHR